jgi:hypothetical protein
VGNAPAVNQAKADALTVFDLTVMVAHPLLVKEPIGPNGPLDLNDLHDQQLCAEQTLRNSTVLSSGVFFWYTESITSLICSLLYYWVVVHCEIATY